MPAMWKEKIGEDQPIPDLESAKHSQGILLCTRPIPIENLNSKQIYNIILRNDNHIPTTAKISQR